MQRDWRYAAAVAVLTLIAVVRVASTHRVFSEVLDEPAHVAAGFEWFQGTYLLDASHPPLARILGTLPLWSFPLPKAKDLVAYGNELLYHGERYEKTLARVRIGNLFLLAIALIATAAWARRAFSKSVALLSVALLGTMPAVLGHAGVLTTDLAALTAITVALLALDLFLEKPSMKRGAFLGLAVGAGLLAKFSFLVFFPPCAVIVLLLRGAFHRSHRSHLSYRSHDSNGTNRTYGTYGRNSLIAAAVAFLVFWGGYRFDFRTPLAYTGPHAVNVFDIAAPEPLRPLARWVAEKLPVPAPAFWVGLGMLKAHDEEGHTAFLFGEHRDKGWWYYFPVVFFYKSPIPFLLLAAWGTMLLIRERDRVRLVYPLIPLAIMAVSMTSSINIGVRHILPLYAPLAIVAAYAVVEIWRRATDGFARAMLVTLLLWLFGGVAAEHPDYLAWFNEAAQPNPARIAVDSNLDWGQDTLRLSRVLREMQINRLHVDILTNARIDGVEAVRFHAAQKVTGWLAVSETALVLHERFGEYQWLSAYRPVRRIGKSIRLYYIPE
ncbi:MAG TPA: glycosyltransferase family 39 protein [Thermoanaerobaculia bacterium]|nr:glycosyltransferase family 39 protein [Thermoanaerobaculia bacterium]